MTGWYATQYLCLSSDMIWKSWTKVNFIHVCSLLTNKIQMFIGISYVPHTSRNQPLNMHIFKLSKSDSNVCYNTFYSTYKWKSDFKLRKFMQVPSVSAVNSADLCLQATSAYTSNGYSIAWVEIFWQHQWKNHKSSWM